jgi:hypothetical protein
MTFFSSKRKYKEDRLSFKYPKYFIPVSLDNISVTFLDKLRPGYSLDMSRVLIGPNDEVTAKKIIESQIEALSKDKQKFSQATFKNISGIHYEKLSSLKEEEIQQMCRLDPNHKIFEMVIHRWELGNDDIYLVFSFGAPADPDKRTEILKQVKDVEEILMTIKTKPDRRNAEIEAARSLLGMRGYDVDEPEE